MKQILILGAGRSASSLVDYLLKESDSDKLDWHIVLGDCSLAAAEEKIAGHANGRAVRFDVQDEAMRNDFVRTADIVLSMLPARFHPLIARTCLSYGTHLVTASYVSDEMKEMDEEARAKGLLFLNECGLDPGIDHMSAMKVIDSIRGQGGEITAFETFTGGLLAPNEEENPWEYKFTWNPRNVVLAGQGSVKFIQESSFKYIPYQKLFRRTEQVYIPGHGYFEGYANRDSLKYLGVYGLQGIRTLYRGTFRRPGFCKAWDIFVQLGATDDTYIMESVGSMRHRDFINAFLSYNPNDSVELKLAHYLGLELEGAEMHKLKWLGVFSNELIGLEEGTPAQLLEHILKKKWTLNERDRDMIVMWHKFDFTIEGEAKQVQSTMIAMGEDTVNTAMAKTVGLPVGIVAKGILQGEIEITGVQVPIHSEIYEPVLKELKNKGIELAEREIQI